jgi:hypothetical protein
MENQELELVGDVSGVQVRLVDRSTAHREMLLATARSIGVVDTAEQAQTAADVILAIKSTRKGVEQAKKIVSGPVQTLLEKIRDTASAFLSPLEDEEKRLIGLIGRHQEIQEAERKRLLAQAKRAETDAQAKAISAHVQTTMTKPVGLSLRTHVNYEVVDLRALYKARPDLCSVIENKMAIRATISGKDGERDIPGLRIWEEKGAATSR